ncbi:hypothetical protein SKAU_G00232130 [Synaphobranchus kaupii]|uniref:Uncharacterized protein n=1 Tax=Synaphobranchus kaupii TaxID=118154 RepID=A0A9Q1F5T2_SYNKA|nr:hypothetical protein SKAU_G00232130 [Synaphobranchus kaupii]
MINGDILEPVEGAVVPDDTAVVQDEDDPQNGEHMRSHLAAALTGSSLRCLLLPGPGCLSCSGSGAENEEASAETVEGSPQDEVIRQGGLMDDHFHIPAVTSPDSVPDPDGGFWSSCNIIGNTFGPAHWDLKEIRLKSHHV